MERDGLTILAIDDEPGALGDLARLLRAAPGVAGVECAQDGDEALRRAASTAFDAVFLDVRMPGLDGVELARVLRRFAAAPELVFVSAHDTAAVDAFELHALDYLRKPVARGRVREAVDRVLVARTAAGGEPGAGAVASDPGRASSPPAGSGSPPASVGADGSADHEVIAVAALHGGATRLLPRREIRYVTSYGDFVRIVTADARYLHRTTLAEIERRWEPHGFVRVHRQFVANLHQAVELRPLLGGTAELAFADGVTIPVARRHMSELGRRLSV
jgi:DNA-binding LytR/AlgR family response regulator